MGIVFDTDVDRSAIVDGDGTPINSNKFIALMAAIVLQVSSLVMDASFAKQQLSVCCPVARLWALYMAISCSPLQPLASANCCSQQTPQQTAACLETKRYCICCCSKVTGAARNAYNQRSVAHVPQQLQAQLGQVAALA